MIIREVFDKFLDAQKKRLKPSTYSQYESVIELFETSLQWYAWNGLPEEEYEKYDEYENAGKRFADIYSHEEICHNMGEFLGYFMRRKVLTSDRFINETAPRVIRRLLRWMSKEGLIDEDTMEHYLLICK